MKRFIRLAAVTTALTAGSMAAIADNGKGYTLKGNIAGLNGGYIYLSYGEGKTDSALVKNGSFVLKGKLEGATVGYLRLAPKGYDNSRDIFLENGDYTISGSKEKLADTKVTGSPNQVLYDKWDAQWQALRMRAKKVYDYSGEAEQKKDTVAQRDAAKQMKALDYSLDSTVTAFITAHPNSPVSAMVIVHRYIQWSYPEKAQKNFPLLGPVAKNSSFGKEISASVLKTGKTAIGATPALALADSTGKLVKLSDFKGKVVMVDFWASWCGPCRKENPNVVKAYQRFHDQGFEIIGVSLDTDKAAWMKAVAKDGLTWTHISDLKGWKSSPVLEFGISSVPTSFIVDKNGKVIAKDLRGEELEAKLAEIFK
ncbi:TlpA disulfide reductase family protein [Chitinophaga sp. sic0106]|uniref:TlpA disulfide reductase family protein n=1 Tax=Chitinophaga sp. sic0106 TaxID=2854785 RepID=UPI001C476AE3|nr:TlpA disulfide reductase family protein [Chitinophaga sp. sic0106]MBV7531397.1 AhpC/TSA family protein [Chitinophaga sp. sic0106]